MRVEIDTDKKTLKIYGRIPVKEVTQFVELFGLHSYTIQAVDETFQNPWPKWPPNEPLNSYKYTGEDVIYGVGGRHTSIPDKVTVPESRPYIAGTWSPLLKSTTITLKEEE